MQRGVHHQSSKFVPYKMFCECSQWQGTVKESVVCCDLVHLCIAPGGKVSQDTERRGRLLNGRGRVDTVYSLACFTNHEQANYWVNTSNSESTRDRRVPIPSSSSPAEFRATPMPCHPRHSHHLQADFWCTYSNLRMSAVVLGIFIANQTTYQRLLKRALLIRLFTKRTNERFFVNGGFKNELPGSRMEVSNWNIRDW